MTFNIYVASYHRWNTTTVWKQLEYCTYVVRKSEEEAYREAGIQSILAVEDDQICSFVKVHNWLIDNAPEDIICVLDDDIETFYYRLSRKEKLKNPMTITREMERFGQMIADLDIGLMGSPITAVPYYHMEFKFSGTIGPIRIYNRAKLKSRYIEMPFFTDTDFVLQELLNNRIILHPEYFVSDAHLEVNKGGMNMARHKRNQNESYRKLREKWGKYVVYNPKNNVTKIVVSR